VTATPSIYLSFHLSLHDRMPLHDRSTRSGGERMTDELFFLRVIIASCSQNDREMFRQAAAVAPIPMELLEADSVGSANRLTISGVDLAFFDSALGEDSVARMTSTARAVAKPPFTVLLCAPGATAQFHTDALASMPADLEEATRLLAGATRVRLPSRVLVVDDSTTMRGIVRKIFAATRFPLDITEAAQGGEAIDLARRSQFDIAFIDQHLPGLSGLETIADFRRAQRDVTFVLMTSAADHAVVQRARAQGAGFLKKHFFPVDIETVLCGF
jgi:CheY-like chemotaxis protein